MSAKVTIVIVRSLHIDQAHMQGAGGPFVLTTGIRTLPDASVNTIDLNLSIRE